MVQYAVFPGRGGTPLQPQQFYIPSQAIVSTQFAQTNTLAVGEQIALARSSGKLLSIVPPSRFFLDLVVSPLLTLQAHGWPSAVTLTQRRAAAVPIAVTSAQLMALLKRAIRLIAIGQSQLIGDVVGSVSKIISFAQTAFATVVRSKASPKAIAVASAETVTLARARGYRLTSVLVSAQRFALDMLVSAVTTLQAHGQPDVKTLVRSLRRTISVSLADLKTLARSVSTGQVTYPQVINIVTADVKILLRRFGRQIVVGSPDLKTLTRSIVHPIAGVIADVKTLTPLRRIARTITVSIGDLKTLARTALHRVTASIAQADLKTLAQVRFFRRTLNVLIADVKTLANQTTGVVQYAKTLLVATADFKTLSRAIRHALNVATADIKTLAAQVAHLRTILVSISDAKTLASLKAAPRLISVALAETMTLSALRRLLRTISIAVADIKTLTAKAAHTALLLVSQSEAVTLAVRSAKLLAVAFADLKSLARTRPRTVTISIGQVLTRTALRLRIAAVSVLQGSLVTLRRSARVAIVISQAIAITVRRSLHKFVTVLQPESLLARASHVFKQAINSAHALLVHLLRDSRAGYKRIVQILGSVVAHYDLIGAVISTSSALGSVVYHWLSIGKVVTDAELDGSVKKTQPLKGDDILKS